jgi:hypothetical protein
MADLCDKHGWFCDYCTTSSLPACQDPACQDPAIVDFCTACSGSSAPVPVATPVPVPPALVATFAINQVQPTWLRPALRSGHGSHEQLPKRT